MVKEFDKVTRRKCRDRHHDYRARNNHHAWAKLWIEYGVPVEHNVRNVHGHRMAEVMA